MMFRRYFTLQVAVLRLKSGNLFVISMFLALSASVAMAQQASAKTASGKSQGSPSKTQASGKTASTSGKTSSSAKRRRSRKGAWKRKGQQVIQPERARAIQEALIREHYLSGEPTGKWDARTEAAMVRYQADNGWQSKVTPDSRALIKLGLGPDYSNQVLNSKSDAVASANSSSGAAGQDK
jgi:peptidoglycan hydrolase-like protein with peptidoglycan-binding domain